MPLLKALEVTVMWDDFIKPPGPKMIVCVEPSRGFFFRINTEGKWQFPVPLARFPMHTFLDRDSNLECGDPLELDDYVLDECLRRHGVIGRIDAAIAPAIYKAVEQASTLSPADKVLIKAALGIP